MILLLRVLERIHGHLGWLSAAALVHPAILLRNPWRRANLSAALAASLTLLTASLGAFLYPEYRSRLKLHVFVEAPTLGWLFERKEHLAVGGVAFALVGCVAHLAVPVFHETVRPKVARLAHRAFVIAFVLVTLVATLGVAVASYTSF